MMYLTPLRFHRRQLHVLQPMSGGIRKSYGSTQSHQFERGSLIKHIKFGICYIGGYMKDRISLHHVKIGTRLTQTAKPVECKFLTYNTWRGFLPALKDGVSASQKR